MIEREYLQELPAKKAVLLCEKKMEDFNDIISNPVREDEWKAAENYKKTRKKLIKASKKEKGRILGTHIKKIVKMLQSTLLCGGIKGIIFRMQNKND